MTQLNQSFDMDQAVYKMAFLIMDSGSPVNEFEITSNLVIFNIYYSSMQYMDTKTNPGYSFFGLLSDIGGALSLVLGTTLYALIQIMDSVVGLLWLFITEKLKKTRIVDVIG